MKDDAGIPTINIKSLLKERDNSYTHEDRSATASGLLQACESHGLFFVTGHGITAARRRLAFENARRFFSLPQATKRKIPAKKGGFTRGYIGFGGESGSDRLECKEAFSYGYPWPESQPPKNALQGANIWPESDELGDVWREDMIALFRSMLSVNEAVATGLSLCLDLGLEALPDLCRGGDTISLFRVFHYFPYCNDSDNDHGCDENEYDYRKDCGEGEGKGKGKDVASVTGAKGDQGQAAGGRGETPPPTSSSTVSVPRTEKIGSSPHTDWGLSTSILQDGAGGLQFLDQNTQRWVDVPCAAEDALVFNCGDYMSLLTKGRLNSPVHRVITTGVERTSFVFFFYPSFDATLPVQVTPSIQATDSVQTTASLHATDSVQATASVQATDSVEATPACEGPPSDGGAGAACGPDPSRASIAVKGVPLIGGREQQEGARVGHNTLFDLTREADGALDVSFGQYLARKWGDVFRE